MYKLIASDLDETLLDYHGKAGCRNIQAIEKAKQKGVKFVIATGRPYFSTTNTLQEIGLYQLPEEYSLTLNGAAVIENGKERPLFCEGLDYEVINTLFQEALKYNVGIHVYTDNQVYGWKITDEERDYVSRRNMPVKELPAPDLEPLKNENFVKILFVNTDENYLRSIARDLEDQTRDLEISYSSNRYLEFNKSGIHKGFGLKKLGEILDIKPEEMIAIGDNFNDLEMIKYAGLGVGTANSNPGILPDCQYVTKARCGEGAIAEVIEKFVLNPA